MTPAFPELAFSVVALLIPVVGLLVGAFVTYYVVRLAIRDALRDARREALAEKGVTTEHEPGAGGGV